MKLLYRYKYKIYKRFQSEIWGDIVLSKKFNNLYKFILDNFNYNLRQFYRKNFINFFQYLKFLKNKKKNSSYIFFFKKINLTPLLFNKNLILNEKFSKVFNKSKMKNFSKNNKIINYSYSIFWLNLFNIYLNMNNLLLLNLDKNAIKLKFNFNNYIKIDDLKFKTILFLSYFKKRIIKKKQYKKKLFNRFPNRLKNIHFKKNRYSIYDHLMSDYTSEKKKYYFKKKRSTWWNLKIEQDKINVFFGFFSRKKFLKFQQACFFANKLRLNWILNLVARLSFILFQMNISSNLYFTRNFIKRGFVLVNNKVKINPNYIVNLFDNISFKKNIFKKIYLMFKFRLKNNKILINSPNYLEINYRIMTSTIWRMPEGSEIIGPFDFPFKTFSYDWLIYKNYK